MLSPGLGFTTGHDDDGEGGAGKRLQQLLEQKDVRDGVIPVSRWYGGKPLGGARFRQITGVANALLEKIRLQR